MSSELFTEVSNRTLKRIYNLRVATEILVDIFTISPEQGFSIRDPYPKTE